ncbi:MAG: LemA family protein, partial [Vicinamibacteria bacterium]
MIPGLVLLGLLVIFVLFLVGIYNSLVTLRNRFKNAFSQIDVQLKRRYDLIPNLVETARGYMKHEREALEAVIKARNTAFGAAQAAAQNPGEPAAMQSLASAEGALSAGLGRLLAL